MLPLNKVGLRIAATLSCDKSHLVRLGERLDKEMSVHTDGAI